MEPATRIDPTDEQLVARIQGGDAEAFAAIFARHRTRLGRFLRSLGVPDSDVDDLLGETFCRALARIREFDISRGTRYVTYLYSISRNLAVDRSRGRIQLTSLENIGGDLEPADDVREDTIVEQIYLMEQVRLIWRAMERLSPSDREILTLAYDRELSCREIQAITGKPSVSAVTTHVYKAMRKLRAHVDELAKAATVG
jgi:RNA polymerase sigma factor (sigma-70 family)